MRVWARLFLYFYFIVLTCGAVAQTGFTAQSYQVPYGFAIRVADFNKDGKPDLLVLGGPSYLLLSNGSGVFGAPQTISAPILTNVTVRDMNGDGAQDIVECGTDAGNQEVVNVLLNDGSGHFTLSQSAVLPYSCYGVFVWDVNHDGKLDVVTTGSNGFVNGSVNYIETLFGDGAGHLTARVPETGISRADPN